MVTGNNTINKHSFEMRNWLRKHLSSVQVTSAEVEETNVTDIEMNHRQVDGDDGGHHVSRLPFIAVALISCNSGCIKTTVGCCGFLPVILSFILYNLEILVFLVKEIYVESMHGKYTINVLVQLVLAVMQVILWACIIRKRSQLPQLITSFESIRQRICGPSSKPPDKKWVIVHYIQVIVLLIPFVYPVILAVTAIVGNDTSSISRLFGLTYDGEDHEVTTLSKVALLPLLLLSCASRLLLHKAFAVYYVSVCRCTQELLSSFRQKIDADPLRIQTLYDDYHVVFRALDVAESALNVPMLFYTGNIFLMFLVGTASTWGFFKTCESRTECILYYSYFVDRIFCYFFVSCAASEVSQAGGDLKSSFSAKLMESTIWRESRDALILKDAINNRSIAYTGCNVFQFTRSFVLASIGTMMTYTLLILQMG